MIVNCPVDTSERENFNSKYCVPVFSLDFIVQFLLAKIDKAGILTKQNYVKKFYFENFENARRADDWIQNVRQIRRK